MADAKALLRRPVVAIVCAVLGVGGVASVRAAVTPYWRTPGWGDLSELASGVDANVHHLIGAAHPELTIVEFSDYECPHCRAAHKKMRMLLENNPKVRLVHRHFPLEMACNPKLTRPLHLRACEFAKAAECAGRQGDFWQMNDALFSIQETVKTKDVDPQELAVRLGLNRSEFVDCMSNPDVESLVSRDVETAVEKNLRGTPAFVLGDEVFMGRVPQVEMSRRLESARAAR